MHLYAIEVRRSAIHLSRWGVTQPMPFSLPPHAKSCKQGQGKVFDNENVISGVDLGPSFGSSIFSCGDKFKRPGFRKARPYASVSPRIEGCGGIRPCRICGKAYHRSVAEYESTLTASLDRLRCGHARCALYAPENLMVKPQSIQSASVCNEYPCRVGRQRGDRV